MSKDNKNIAQILLTEVWGKGHVGIPLSKQPKPINLKPATSQVRPFTQSNWSDIDRWADYFSDPRVIQQKVSGDNFSYTMDDVLNKALFHMQNPTVWKKEDVLKTAQQELKAYVDNSSLNPEAKNYLRDKFSNPQNVENFLNQFEKPQNLQVNALASTDKLPFDIFPKNISPGDKNYWLNQKDLLLNMDDERFYKDYRDSRKEAIGVINSRTFVAMQKQNPELAQIYQQMANMPETPNPSLKEKYADLIIGSTLRMEPEDLSTYQPALKRISF